MNGWKVLGLAGLVGLTATGAVVVRDERRRQAVTPEQVRARLHARHAELVPVEHPAPAAAPVAAAPGRLSGLRSGALCDLLRRGRADADGRP